MNIARQCSGRYHFRTIVLILFIAALCLINKNTFDNKSSIPTTTPTISMVAAAFVDHINTNTLSISSSPRHRRTHFLTSSSNLCSSDFSMMPAFLVKDSLLRKKQQQQRQNECFILRSSSGDDNDNNDDNTAERKDDTEEEDVEDPSDWELDDEELEILFEEGDDDDDDENDNNLDEGGDKVTTYGQQKDLDNSEKAWRHCKKHLLSIGSKGIAFSHGNSLRQLLDSHTTVKVKINTVKYNDSLQEAYDKLKEVAVEAGASPDMELIQARDSENCILVGLPGTISKIESGDFPPSSSSPKKKKKTPTEDN